MNSTELRHWLATADAPPARWVRRTLRAMLRLRARLSSGSVSAEMDRIVAEANSATTGSALTAELQRRRRDRDGRSRQRRVTDNGHGNGGSTTPRTAHRS